MYTISKEFDGIFTCSRPHQVKAFIAGILNRDKKEFLPNESSVAFCREYVANSYINNYYRDRTLFKRPSIAIAVRTAEVEKHMIKAKRKTVAELTRLLNRFERKLHWKQTVVHELGFPSGLVETECAYLFEFSRCWVNNIILLYCYLGFIVMSAFNKNAVLISNIAERSDTLEEFVNHLYAAKMMPGYSYEYARIWPDVIKNRGVIFKGFTTEDLFSITRKAGRATARRRLYGFGIHRLCDRDLIAGRIVNKSGETLLESYNKWYNSR